MTTRQLTRAFGGALVAAVLVFSSPANADTQLIHFDDTSQGWQWYSTADRNFTFDPTNMSASSLCADTTEDSGNGACVLEGGQGVLPLMIRPTNQTISQGSSGGNAEPDFAGGDGPGDLLAFTLDSFYFLLNGSGTGNSMTVCGGTGAPPNPDIETIDGTKDGDPTAICEGAPISFTFSEDGSVSPSGPTITYYEDYAGRGDINAVAGAAVTGSLVKQTGYIASFGDLFADVSWIQWTASGDAQFRLDCVVATFDGTTTEPLSGFTGGCGGGATVPEPGTVALLGLGLVGMGLMRRRRKV